jgi:hypothetical protein
VTLLTIEHNRDMPKWRGISTLLEGLGYAEVELNENEAGFIKK